MRFGDYVICVALMAVILALIAFPLDMVLFSVLGISGMSSWGSLGCLIVSLFVSALISGYVFAGKIWESRMGTIARITVLWAAFVMLVAIIVPATLADWGLKAWEEYLAMYPGAILSTNELVTWEMMSLDMFMFLVVGLALVFGFIGLYVGSMLRRPGKSGK